METQNHDASPPRTPPSQLTRVAKGKNGVRATTSRPPVQSVFANSSDQGNGRDVDGEHRRHRSSSHDLSWSPNHQRVSVVDNMLLSLDQFSGAGASSYNNTDYGDYESEERAPAFHKSAFHTPPGARSRTQTTSSTSSDYNLPSDTPPKTRTHRSNSSQNFQSNLGRIDSVRRMGEGKEEDIQEHSPRKTGNVHPGGARRSSKGSGSSSFDYGRLAGGQWQRLGGRRSASFDDGYARPDLLTAMTKPPFAPAAGSGQPDFYEDLNAAPTPTIPVGPRRNESPARSPAARPDSSLSSSRGPVRGRGSLRTPMGIFSRPDRSVSPRRPDARNDRHDRPSNLRQHSNNDDNVDAGLWADTPERSTPGMAASAPNSGSQVKEKERPGFFRRVFGSGRAATGPHDESPTQVRRNASEPFTSITGRVDAELPLRTSQQAAPIATPKDTVRSKKGDKVKEQPSLNKKPSFFRRRKKSVAEAIPLPDPLPQLHSNWTTAAPRPDSPSSLRNALDPYLTRAQASDTGFYGDPLASSEEPPRNSSVADAFSNSKATIRPVNNAQDAELVVRNSPKQAHKSKQSRELKISTDPRSPANNAGGSHAPSHSHSRTLSDVDKALPSLPGKAGREVAKPASNKPSEPGSINYEGRVITATTTSTTTVADQFRQTSDTITSVRAGDDAEQPERWKLWLLANDSDEQIAPPPRAPNTTPNPARTLEAPRKASEDSDYRTADSRQTSPQLPPATGTEGESAAVVQEPAPATIDDNLPTLGDRQLALQLFNGESDVNPPDTATWLGDEGSDRGRVRKAFMELFDWRNMSILAALRGFCRQVKLVAETQQLDRLLGALSMRWCECNPRHGFQVTGMFPASCCSSARLTDPQMSYTLYASRSCC